MSMNVSSSVSFSRIRSELMAKLAGSPLAGKVSKEIIDLLETLGRRQSAESSPSRVHHPKHRLAHHHKAGHKSTLGSRASTLASAAADTASSPQSPIGGTAASNGLPGGIDPQCFSEALTPQQQQTLNDPNLSPAEKARMQAQYAMQNHQEVMEFISNIMKMMHDTQMAIVGNIR